MAAPMRVWSRFIGRKKNGDVLKFRIQDLPEQFLPTAVEFYIDHFVKHEVLHKASGIYKSNEALNEMRSMMHENLRKSSTKSVVLLDETGGAGDRVVGTFAAILGTTDTHLRDARDLLATRKTKEVRKYLEMLLEMNYQNLYPMPEKYGIQEFYDDLGTAIHPGYRDLGLATTCFLEVRKICRKPVVAWVTALGSQKAVQHSGYETACEVSYELLARRHGVVFEGNPPTAKLVFARPLEVPLQKTEEDMD